MKTIREWLEELPEPYRTQALMNVGPEESESYERNLKNALWGAFLWDRSPEGWDYWYGFYSGLGGSEGQFRLTLPTPPPVIASIATTATHLFALGTDGRVYQAAHRDEPATEQFWTPLPPLP